MVGISVAVAEGVAVLVGETTMRVAVKLGRGVEVGSGVRVAIAVTTTTSEFAAANQTVTDPAARISNPTQSTAVTTSPITTIPLNWFLGIRNQCYGYLFSSQTSISGSKILCGGKGLTGFACWHQDKVTWLINASHWQSVS
jgi:hypothetical protein